MSATGLIAVAVLSGAIASTDPVKPSAPEVENVISINFGESYLVDADLDIAAIHVNPPNTLTASLIDPRTVKVSGNLIGDAMVHFLDVEGRRLFSAQFRVVKVAPRLWGQP